MAQDIRQAISTGHNPQQGPQATGQEPIEQELGQDVTGAIAQGLQEAGLKPFLAHKAGHGGEGHQGGDQVEDHGEDIAHIGHALGPQLASVELDIAWIGLAAVNPVLRRHQASQTISSLVKFVLALLEGGLGLSFLAGKFSLLVIQLLAGRSQGFLATADFLAGRLQGLGACLGGCRLAVVLSLAGLVLGQSPLIVGSLAVILGLTAGQGRGASLIAGQPFLVAAIGGLPLGLAGFKLAFGAGQGLGLISQGLAGGLNVWQGVRILAGLAQGLFLGGQGLLPGSEFGLALSQGLALAG